VQKLLALSGSFKSSALRAGMGEVGNMSWPDTRSDSAVLRALVIGIGLCWSVAFVAIGLYYELELYADGAMFSYAVAVQDVWAFHWHNISGRMSVFFLTLLPAEIVVGLTGSPRAGIAVYGLLFYIAPLSGLIGTFVADHSRHRSIFVYACCSTALLCPLIFGFPTEMWLAHAVFWPTLAVSCYAKRTTVGMASVFVMMLTLAFTHEGALVLAFAIVAMLAARGLRDVSFLRAAAVCGVVVAIAAAVKIALPPDEYYGDVFLRAALHFFDPGIFQVSIVILLFAVLAGYGVIFLVLSHVAPGRACLYALAAVAVMLSTYWLWIDQAIHASSRYYLRTALVLLTPIFGALAALGTMSGDDRIAEPLPFPKRAMATMRNQGARPLAAAFILLTLVHIIETGKFVTAWRQYRAAVEALATGDESDPALGNPHFVSSERIASNLNRLSWFSTTPFFSVIVANFRPNRLIIDPSGNYFWLSCATATANDAAARPVPKEGRDLVRIYSCLHR
jgi:hypothetical protein